MKIRLLTPAEKRERAATPKRWFAWYPVIASYYAIFSPNPELERFFVWFRYVYRTRRTTESYIKAEAFDQNGKLAFRPGGTFYRAVRPYWLYSMTSTVPKP